MVYLHSSTVRRLLLSVVALGIGLLTLETRAEPFNLTIRSMVNQTVHTYEISGDTERLPGIKVNYLSPLASRTAQLCWTGSTLAASVSATHDGARLRVVRSLTGCTTFEFGFSKNGTVTTVLQAQPGSDAFAPGTPGATYTNSIVNGDAGPFLRVAQAGERAEGQASPASAGH